MPERRPDGVINVWRRGIWRPWRWSYREFYGMSGPHVISLPIEGRAWTKRAAYAHAWLARRLRGEGRRQAS